MATQQLIALPAPGNWPATAALSTLNAAELTRYDLCLRFVRHLEALNAQRPDFHTHGVFTRAAWTAIHITYRTNYIGKWNPGSLKSFQDCYTRRKREIKIFVRRHNANVNQVIPAPAIPTPAIAAPAVPAPIPAAILVTASAATASGASTRGRARRGGARGRGN
ncbi:hypothetical protein B0O99DRAFT_299371 [Bisporella sp. PMI_857]|nr:hypothetical protein B0O99DRAFT_299371 [Bisporella sp. PMI_857]